MKRSTSRHQAPPLDAPRCLRKRRHPHHCRRLSVGLFGLLSRCSLRDPTLKVGPLSVWPGAWPNLAPSLIGRSAARGR